MDEVGTGIIFARSILIGVICPRGWLGSAGRIASGRDFEMEGLVCGASLDLVCGASLDMVGPLGGWSWDAFCGIPVSGEPGWTAG